MDWLFDIVLKWFVGYLAKVGESLDFEYMRAKIKEMLEPLPDFLEMPIVAAVDHAVDALKAALKDEKNLKELLEALAAQDWVRAFKELQELLGAKRDMHVGVVDMAAAAGRLKACAEKAQQVKAVG